MKSIVLASASGLIDVALITAVFRLSTVKRRVATMVGVFLGSAPFFVAVHLWTPPDLGVLPVALAESARALDLAFGLLLFTAGFFGGILQVYNLADRGFSLRILIDLHESPRGVLTVAEIAQSYSRGRGLQWMYDKRIDGLIERELVQVDGDVVRSTARGERAAAVFGWLRDVLNLQPRR